MATLMRCARSVCTTSNRCVRRQIVCVSTVDTVGIASDSQSQEKATSKRESHVLSSRPSHVHAVEGLRYEKAHPDDKRVLDPGKAGFNVGIQPYAQFSQDSSTIRLVSLARSKKLRSQQGKILLEGRRLISDALDAGASPLAVFFSTEERLHKLPVNRLAHASLVKVKLDDVQIWPDLDMPLDMIAIFRRPDVSKLSFSEEKYGKALPLTLICDNLRDPGNLGATLHCAAAAGCHSVLLSSGCVDIWEPKVLRAAMGAHFRLPIIPNLSWTDLQNHLPSTTTVHVADNSSNFPVTKPELLGTSRRRKKPGEYGWVNSRQISLKECGVDEDEEDKAGGSKQTYLVLETQPYHTGWIGNHTAVVIGGETHGLSREALQLAEETGGRRLLISMVRGVDSLNAAMAASVLLFEGRRQLSAK